MTWGIIFKYTTKKQDDVYSVMQLDWCQTDFCFTCFGGITDSSSVNADGNNIYDEDKAVALDDCMTEISIMNWFDEEYRWGDKAAYAENYFPLMTYKECGHTGCTMLWTQDQDGDKYRYQGWYDRVSGHITGAVRVDGKPDDAGTFSAYPMWEYWKVARRAEVEETTPTRATILANNDNDHAYYKQGIAEIWDTFAAREEAALMGTLLFYQDSSRMYVEGSVTYFEDWGTSIKMYIGNGAGENLRSTYELDPYFRQTNCNLAFVRDPWKGGTDLEVTLTRATTADRFYIKADSAVPSFDADATYPITGRAVVFVGDDVRPGVPLMCGEIKQSDDKALATGQRCEKKSD